VKSLVRSGSRTRGPIVVIVSAVLAGGVLLGACGGSSDGDSGAKGFVEPKGPAAETLTVEAGNFYFDPDEITAAPGVTKLDLQGAGGIHTLVFEGAYPGFQLEITGTDDDAKKIDLKPGTYTFYCDITGHRQQGMEGTLTVK
jgi:plastocyanin